MPKTLSTAHLSNSNGEVKMYGVKKHEAVKFVDATKDLDDVQRLVVFELQNAVESIEKSVSRNHCNTGEEMIGKELLSNPESDPSSVKEDVSSAHDELDIILKLLVPK